MQNEYNALRFYNQTFAGLTNVSVLDLTGCPGIDSDEFYNALSDETILPKLSHLILVGFRAWGPFKITQDFVNIIGVRDIVDMNLSFTPLTTDINDLTPVCDTLRRLNISNTIISKSKFYKNITCPSIRIVDVSGAHFPNIKIVPKLLKLAHLYLGTGRFPLPILKTVTTIYANSLISPDHEISFLNCTFDVSTENDIREVHTSNYNVPTFDIELKPHPDHLNYFDLSSNRIETVGPNIFRSLPKLTKLDLYNNKLSKCTSFSETFSSLFRHNVKLQELNMANNGLASLPRDTFARNMRLKHLDLSDNKIANIMFDISHLNNLTVLNLRNNKIEYLNKKKNTDILDQLYDWHQLKHHIGGDNETLKVDLTENPLSCKCASLEFIEWFSKAPVFSRTRHLYQCEINGRHVDMNDVAIAEAKDDCEKPIRRQQKIILSSTIPTLGVLITIMVAVLVRKRHKQRLDDKKFIDTVERLRNGGIGFEIPVFLSFSSEDERFVIDNIQAPLQVKYTRKYKCIYKTIQKIYKWPSAWQNQQNNLCAQQRVRSSWASAQSDQSSLFAQWTQVSSCGQRRLWSDWADAQADLSSLGAHVMFWFCHAAAQIKLESPWGNKDEDS